MYLSYKDITQNMYLDKTEALINYVVLASDLDLDLQFDLDHCL